MIIITGMRAYYLIKLVFHTFMTSQILLNTPTASYFSILKWQHNEALCTPTPLSSKYYSYCVPSRCADTSKEEWPFFWLLEGVYKWLSKKFPQAGIHQWRMCVFKISSEQHILYYSRYLPPSEPRTSLFLCSNHVGCHHCISLPYHGPIFFSLELITLSVSNTPFWEFSI